MSISVGQTRKHGATGEITERIAEVLPSPGQRAETRPVQHVDDLGGYQRFGIASVDAAGRRTWAGGSPMSAPTPQPSGESSAGAAGRGADSQLLMDRFLPRFDLAVVHADVFRALPAECYQAANEMDLFQAPLVRTLLGIRGLPRRVVGTLRARGQSATLGASPRTFRLKDMVALGWILLGETPGVQLVLGQVSHPWKAVADSIDAPTTPEQFTSFDEPGFAKIATSLKIDPYGQDASILTMETRVALTDDESRRRFRRYWLLVGPFSSLIRRMALRLLATELRRAAPGTPPSSAEPARPRRPRPKGLNR